MKEGKKKKKRLESKAPVCLFVPCSCASSLGTEEAEGKRETAQVSCLPLKFITVAERSLYLDGKMKKGVGVGGGEGMPQDWNVGDTSAWQIGFS